MTSRNACKGPPGIALLNKNDLPPKISAGDLECVGIELPILSFSACEQMAWKI